MDKDINYEKFTKAQLIRLIKIKDVRLSIKRRQVLRLYYLNNKAYEMPLIIGYLLGGLVAVIGFLLFF